MGSGINLYLASEFEYRRGLAHRLLDEGIIDFCLTDYLPWTEAPTYDERIVTVDHTPSANDEYNKVCDINELPAVSQELMERMLPYESMAIHIGMRRFNYPTTEYDEEKRKYLQHLRYWNYMFDKYNINLIVTHCIPHSQGKYVVYGLAQVRGIPMLIWHQGGFFTERCVWGDSLEHIGQSIGDKYESLSNSESNLFVLDKDIEDVYNKCLYNSSKIIRQKYDIEIRKRHSGLYDESYKYQKKKYIRIKIKSKIKAWIRGEGKGTVNELDVWLRLYRRHLYAVKYFKKFLSYSIEDYNKISYDADYNLKYILYLPQVYPEAVVVPAAGVFAEQYNSIQLLAHIAEKLGIYVYVKEHPHLPYRAASFYSDIRSIKNVRLIKTTELSHDLIKNSVAVATQTGTCLLEAMVQRKPTIVFGDGYFWKKAPGLFEIKDEKQGLQVLNTILKGVEITEEDVKRYFYAVQLETLKETNVEDNLARVLDDNYNIEQFPLDDRIELIKQFIFDKKIQTLK